MNTTDTILAWLAEAKPTPITNSEFEQGVIRGFEIIEAQFANGHVPLGKADAP